MKRRFIPTALGFSVAAALVPAVARACAVCLTGAGDDPVADAFNWSVLFLMATPYAVVGSIAGWLLVNHRRANSMREEAGAQRAPVESAWIEKESGR